MTPRRRSNLTDPTANTGGQVQHFYIYGPHCQQNRYKKTVGDIETHLTDLELMGRIGRLGPLKNAREMVTQALRGGARTIVAVGDDHTVAEVINAVAGSEVALGVIPVGEQLSVAKLLGIPVGAESCNVLAARKIELVDVGKINTLYFLTDVAIEGTAPLTLACDDRYRLEAKQKLIRARLVNLGPNANCQDGYLEAFITLEKRGWFSKQERTSTVPFRRATLTSTEDAVATVANAYSAKLPATIEVIPKSLKVIVGKERAF